MARSKQSAKRRKGGNNRESKGKKRRKIERKFWIQDCPDTQPPEDISDGVVFDVMITRVELSDDYKQVSQASKAMESLNVPDESTDSKTEVASEGANQQNFIELPKPEKEDSNNDLPEQKEPSSTLIDSTSAQNSGSHHDDLSDTIVDGEAAKDTSIEPANGSSQDDPGEKTKPAVRPYIVIKRTASAKGRLRNSYENEDDFKPLPNGDCGDGTTNPYSNEEVPDKFWSQRRRLFSRFDSGIQLDKESWYSVTPEAIANHIAAHMVSNNQNKVTILDMFCGCGGNAIAFARRDEVKCVVCIDSDLEKLRKAAHNAKIYDVAPEKMIFIHSGIGNVLKHFNDGKLQKDHDSNANTICLEKECNGYKIGGTSLLPESIDMTFMSPPWGGVNYGKVGKRNYNLGCIALKEDGIDYNGNVLLKQTSKALGPRPLALFLPRNINGQSLGQSMVRCGYQGPLVMEQNILNGKLKTITTYVGFG
ncbi:unnamed protein product [Cylindrotheca closterium]|uniref:Trimethylguanosine synthase n=1 Tax=Cylindrotheca closterium TaxID=2856 RepID=A0AAD2GC53_9STRA|nr:unnamed protein product [Cylindrotheca closterium]